MRSKHYSLCVLFLVAIFFISVSGVYSAPSSDYPLEVVVTGPGFTDTIRFADHTGSLSEGNWIVLSGGADLTLPAMTLSYSGVTAASYQRGANTVTI